MGGGLSFDVFPTAGGSTSISGNVVNANISGQYVFTSISGNVVNATVVTNISGQTVVAQISGQSVSIIGSIPSNVSGNVVYFTSGKNEVIITNALPLPVSTSISGNFINTLVSVSGNLILTSVSGNTVIAKISGESVSIIGTVPVTTSVSGNVFATSISGNIVNTSGQVANIAGQTILTSISGNQILTSVSGNLILTSISGNQVLTSVSGNLVNTSVSGNQIRNQLFDPSGATWLDIWNDASGSHRVPVSTSISGNLVLASISGNQVLTSVSGNLVLASVSGNLILTSVSGNMVSVSGQPANISGNVVLTTISGNVVNISGNVVNANTSISGNVVVVPFTSISGNVIVVPSTSISGNMVSISGQPVSVSVQTNVSGNVVYLISGQNNVQMSGQTVSIAGTVPVSTSISGNMISISGQPVSVSGNVVVASVTTNISGQVVNISGYPVNVSGATIIALISGQTVVASVTTNISGQVVYHASGFNDVQMSGQSVVISGQIIRSIPISAGGVSNAFVNVNSDSGTANSVGAINASYIHGYVDAASGTWARIRVTNSGQGMSGVNFKLAVDFSGSVATISGNVVYLQDASGRNAVRLADFFGGPLAATSFEANNHLRVWISGQPVSISGIVQSNVSGSTVYLASGQNAVATFTPATYTAFFDNIVPTSGGVMVAMAYKSGVSVISIKKMFITNIEPALISGQYVRFDVCRISGLFSGGTAISANPMDPLDTSSGASINIVTAPAGGSSSLWPVAARAVLFNWATTTAGWMSGAIQASLAGSLNQMGQSFNILPESTEMKEVRLTSGYGIIIQQTLAQTNYTQVTSGKYAVTISYTVQ